MTPVVAVDRERDVEVGAVAAPARSCAGGRTRAGSPRVRDTMAVPVTVQRPVDRTFWQYPAGWTKVSGRVSVGERR